MRRPYLPVVGSFAAPAPLKRVTALALCGCLGGLMAPFAAAQTAPAAAADEAVKPPQVVLASRSAPVLASNQPAPPASPASASPASASSVSASPVSPSPARASATAVSPAPANPANATAARPTAPAISRTSSTAPKAPQADQVAVIEDDGARIEETRRRGQVVRVQVQSKVGSTRGYDIVVKPGAEPAAPQRGAAGRSAWQLFSF